MEEKIKRLSASRIKTLKSCSWTYWCKYHLKLPDQSNSGAERGNVCHLVFELLLNKRHKKHFNSIVKKKTIKASKAVNRLVEKHMKASEILSADYEANYESIDKMILVGLNHDFFCKGMTLFDPEYEFNLDSKNPRYVARGFIDKWAIDEKNKLIKIMDYKSSKKKFEDDELDSNIQAMLYSVVAKKTYPDYKCIVEFIFLKYEEDPSQTVSFNDIVLEGFEKYLEDVNEKMNKFSYADAVSDMASYQPMSKGFTGKLLCGFAKEPGELKLDGTLKWHCPFKFAFDYYVLLDDKGEFVMSAHNKEDCEKSPLNKKGFKIKPLHYGGCPAHVKRSLTNF